MRLKKSKVNIMLDNMIFALGSGLSSGELHIYTDLPTVVGGRSGGAIATDRHVQSPEGTPIANLWLTMAQTMGVKTDRIADSTGVLKVA
jgi:hypothetical protein